MLPPTCASLPALRTIWPSRAVVVDLPFVPVMATTFGFRPSAQAATVRANSSTSPRISTRSARARSTVQWGLGCVRGTPGDSIRASKSIQSAARRSTTGRPSAIAAARASGFSSQSATSAPPATSARAAVSPVRARPKTATRLPANPRTVITSPRPPYLSFRVARPARANMMEMIQNRITTVDSCHPRRSK
jgi:hypothetical protein